MNEAMFEYVRFTEPFFQPRRLHLVPGIPDMFFGTPFNPIHLILGIPDMLFVTPFNPIFFHTTFGTFIAPVCYFPRYTAVNTIPETIIEAASETVSQTVHKTIPETTSGFVGKFMKLPLELREDIYSLIIGTQIEIAAPFRTFKSSDKSRLNVLAISKQFHRDARSFLVRRVKIIFRSDSSLEKFVTFHNHIGSDLPRLLCRVVLNYGWIGIRRELPCRKTDLRIFSDKKVGYQDQYNLFFDEARALLGISDYSSVTLYIGTHNFTEEDQIQAVAFFCRKELDYAQWGKRPVDDLNFICYTNRGKKLLNIRRAVLQRKSSYTQQLYAVPGPMTELEGRSRALEASRSSCN